MAERRTPFLIRQARDRGVVSAARPALRGPVSVVFSITMPMENEGSRNDLVDELIRGVDRTLLRENLKLTPAERLAKFANFMRFASGLQRAGARARTIGATGSKK